MPYKWEKNPNFGLIPLELTYLHKIFCFATLKKALSILEHLLYTQNNNR